MGHIIEIIVMLSLVFSMGTTEQRSMLNGARNVLDDGWVKVTSKGEIECKENQDFACSLTKEEAEMLEDNADLACPYVHEPVENFRLSYVVEGYINLKEKQADLAVNLTCDGKETTYHLFIKDDWLYLNTAFFEKQYEKDSRININTEFYKEGYSKNIFQDIKQEYITIPLEQWEDVTNYIMYYDYAVLQQFGKALAEKMPIEYQGSEYTINMDGSKQADLFMAVVDFKTHNEYFGCKELSSEERDNLKSAISKACKNTRFIGKANISKDKMTYDNEFNLNLLTGDRLEGKISILFEKAENHVVNLPEDVKKIKKIDSYYYGARILFYIDDSSTVASLNKQIKNEEYDEYMTSAYTFLSEGHRYIDPYGLNQTFNIVVEYDKKSKQCYWTSLDNIDLGKYQAWDKTFKKTKAGREYPSYIVDTGACKDIKALVLADGEHYLIAVRDLIKAGVAEEIEVEDGTRYVVVSFPLI